MQSMHEEGNTEKHIDICDEVLYKVLVCDATWCEAARRDMGHHYTRSRGRGEMPLCYLKFLGRTPISTALGPLPLLVTFVNSNVNQTLEIACKRSSEVVKRLVWTRLLTKSKCKVSRTEEILKKKLTIMYRKSLRMSTVIKTIVNHWWKPENQADWHDNSYNNG